MNCETELDFEVPANVIAKSPNEHIPPTSTSNATFKINSTKHIPVVTLSINYNIKFLENIKQGFRRTISWNQYRSEIATQPKNNNLGYMIDPTFRSINTLFVFSFMVLMIP